MTELELESADRHQLVKYLLEHVYPSAGTQYKDAVRSELQTQELKVLRAMATLSCRVLLERQKKRQQVRAARRARHNEHSS